MPPRSRSDTLRTLAADCAAYPDALRRAMLPAVGRMLVDVATDAADRVGGRLSRYNRGAGATLTATPSLVGSDTVRLTPTPLGPWTIVESGSAKSEWVIGTPPSEGRGAKRIAMANGGVRWYVRHRKVAGKQVWTRALVAMADQLPDVVHRSAVDTWEQVR
jgi:hypothetical protein